MLPNEVPTTVLQTKLLHLQSWYFAETAALSQSPYQNCTLSSSERTAYQQQVSQVTHNSRGAHLRDLLHRLYGQAAAERCLVPEALIRVLRLLCEVFVLLL